MKYLLLAFIMLFLTACNTREPQTVITTRYMVVDVPTQFYNECKPVQLPNPETLTNLQAANLIKQQSLMNRKCTASLAAIKKYLAEAKVAVEE